MVDLDNTLIDRAGAYRRWAEALVVDQDGSAADVDWLIDADGDGLTDRDQVAAHIADRFGLQRIGKARVLDELRRGLVEHIVADAAVPQALDAARAGGWYIACVTNGTVAQQQRKLDATGLADHVDLTVISEGAGVRKPDPEIFRLAAESARLPLHSAWMVGDSAEADIAGAYAAGANTAWLHRGRPWSLSGVSPTIVADTFVGAVVAIISHSAHADAR
jgi:putative hydrolase of the HAD superfamily